MNLNLMNDKYKKNLQKISTLGGGKILIGGLRGVEKESLRTDPQGRLAKTPHPKILGSALTHPSITTDYSEAQLEFVTAPYARNWEVLQALTEVHQFTAKEAIGEELIWPASMPCFVGSEDDVPVAEFGNSNVGRMKHVYRLGLGHRYGRIMQTISGVHFNFSIPERFWPIYRESIGECGKQNDTFISEQYFHIVRNLRRSSWILLYLFGCSPAICESFDVDNTKLEKFNHSYYLPYATSLRMSDLGYKNDSQSAIYVSANSLSEYVRDLTKAIRTPYPEYEDIGVKSNGKYKQLNTNLLQIENEYYTLVRPKRVTRTGEKPSEALSRAGVQYLELRALDTSLMDPIGVNRDELYFLELLVWYCLFYPSQDLCATEESENSQNQLLVAKQGRKPGLELKHHGENRLLKDWALAMCKDMQPLAEMLDVGLETKDKDCYLNALQIQIEKIENPDKTPSAIVLNEMFDKNLSFHQLTLNIAEQHKHYFSALHLSANKKEHFMALAKSSLAQQAKLETDESENFDAYLKRYFSNK